MNQAEFDALKSQVSTAIINRLQSLKFTIGVTYDPYVMINDEKIMIDYRKWGMQRYRDDCKELMVFIELYNGKKTNNFSRRFRSFDENSSKTTIEELCVEIITEVNSRKEKRKNNDLKRNKVEENKAFLKTLGVGNMPHDTLWLGEPYSDAGKVTLNDYGNFVINVVTDDQNKIKSLINAIQQVNENKEENAVGNVP